MIDTNWQVLERMLDKIIATCMGEGLYTALKAKLDGKTLSIQFNSGSNGSFGVQAGGSVGISLSTNMESGQLLHEMFHALRAYNEVVPTYNNSNMNGEIEAHYAQHIYQSSLPEYQKEGNKWAERDNTDIRWMGISNLKEYIDKNGKLKAGVSDDVLLTEILTRIIPGLKAGGYSDYPFDYDRSGLDNFKCLNEVTIKCVK